MKLGRIVLGNESFQIMDVIDYLKSNNYPECAFTDVENKNGRFVAMITSDDTDSEFLQEHIVGREKTEEYNGAVFFFDSVCSSCMLSFPDVNKTYYLTY